MEWQLQRDSQLSFTEYHVLALLSDQPGRRMRMSELAVMADSELSRLSHMVSRLEKRGLLLRKVAEVRCNGRLLRTALWKPGGEIPPGYPTISNMWLHPLTRQGGARSDAGLHGLWAPTLQQMQHFEPARAWKPRLQRVSLDPVTGEATA